MYALLTELMKADMLSKTKCKGIKKGGTSPPFQ